MNGRIYDPLLGRFLSADILVQNPGSLQSYNRYSYVGNNPLTLVDPSGFQSDVAGGTMSNEEMARRARQMGDMLARNALISSRGIAGFIASGQLADNISSAVVSGVMQFVAAVAQQSAGEQTHDKRPENSEPAAATDSSTVNTTTAPSQQGQQLQSGTPPPESPSGPEAKAPNGLSGTSDSHDDKYLKLEKNTRGVLFMSADMAKEANGKTGTKRKFMEKYVAIENKALRNAGAEGQIQLVFFHSKADLKEKVEGMDPVISVYGLTHGNGQGLVWMSEESREITTTNDEFQKIMNEAPALYRNGGYSCQGQADANVLKPLVKIYNDLKQYYGIE